MKFAALSLAVAAALVAFAGSASAQPPVYYHRPVYGPTYGMPVVVRPAPAVVVPYAYYPPYVYPSTSFFSSGSSFLFSVNKPGFSFSVGSGTATPLYNYGGLYSPYSYGGYGGYGWRR